eukprot:1346059-Heterocapsa_arctica.AAC.1
MIRMREDEHALHEVHAAPDPVLLRLKGVLVENQTDDVLDLWHHLAILLKEALGDAPLVALLACVAHHDMA